MNSKRWILSVIILVFICSSLGCDAFRRKFTRKKKYKEIIEPVLNPDENVGLFYDNDTKYKNYFAYWRGWHDELIQAMSGRSRKRQRYSLEQAIDNLRLMTELLRGEKQEQLNTYIQKMHKISKRLNSNQAFKERDIIRELSHIRLAVNKGLHYSKVKDWISK